MPNFHHTFEPAAANVLGASADLTTREIEDAGLKEILQTPGAALGNWSLLDALLEPGSADFVFREPLGQARELKTALSGLFGRFVARAYATRHLQYSYYQHIYRPPMRLSGPARGEVRRVVGNRGDLPDWAAWSGVHGLAIIEAKGCHDAKGPQAALERAYKQAERAEITIGGRQAPFKRYAIATRWGFATPSATVPRLAVKDPEVTGDGVTPEEVHALGLGIVRRHCASLLGRLGYQELASALIQLASTPFRNRQAQALANARAALDHAPTRRVDTSDVIGPSDDLVGGFITRNGLLSGIELSIPDQQTLARLQMGPTFVGIERHTIKFAIDGMAEDLMKEQAAAALSWSHGGRSGPSNDGAGGWVIRLEQDRSRVI
jgi:hypothetical protein